MTNDNEYNADLVSGITAFDTKNFATAYQLLAPFALEGNVESLFRLGMMQTNGLGMVANQELGFKNLKLAADNGHSFSHHMVAVAYMEGEGVSADINKAIVYFEKASEFDLVGSMYVLSMLYEDGKKVPKDDIKAKYWAEKAASLE